MTKDDLLAELDAVESAADVRIDKTNPEGARLFIAKDAHFTGRKDWFFIDWIDSEDEALINEAFPPE